MMPHDRRRSLRTTLFAISLTSVGRFEFTVPEPERAASGESPTGSAAAPLFAPDGLSGITWIGRSKYLAVSDRHAALFPLTIRVDSVSGAIIDARVEEPAPLRDRNGRLITDPLQGADREDIVYDAAAKSVWIANERSGGTRSRPSLARHDLAGGRMTQFLSAVKGSPLAIFQGIQINQGFESLARAADGRETWTANEGSLRTDGAPMDAGFARVVRLVRFDAQMRVTSQYAYVTDPPEGTITFPPGAESHRDFGLSALLLLEDGTLLSMERALTAAPNGMAEFCDRIYRIDVSGATDVSRGLYAKGLARFHVAGAGETPGAERPSAGRSGSFIPVRKERLIEIVSPLLSVGNFEGMMLGPRLTDGSRSLILIADNDSGRREALYALRLRH